MKPYVPPCLCLSLLIAAAPALAQNRASMGSAREAVIVNARTSALSGLSLTGASGQSVGGISKPVAPGQSVRVKLARGAGCMVSVEASFDDETASDPAQVDVCADKTIRFTD